MRKAVLYCSAFMIILAQLALAQSPRAVAKDFSHSLSIEGAGKLTLTYKSLHFNEPQYQNAKANEQLRTRLNNTLWKKFGKFDADFDTVIAGVKVPKGSYSLGLNFDANDNFKLVLGGPADILIPLQTATDGPAVTHLTFDVRPTDKTDTFLLEGRNGKFRATAEVKVPYLSELDNK